MNWKLVFKPKVIVALVVLLASAGSLNAIVHSLGVWLRKKPIPLAQPLYRMADAQGPYRKIRDEPPLPSDVEKALGATEYITRLYRDTRLAENTSGSVLRLHVAYYTGTVDTVPHVPERCVTASGAQPTEVRTDQIELQSPNLAPGEDGRVAATTALGRRVWLPSESVPLRIITFQHRQQQTAAFTVSYFFVANHSFVSTAEGVRLQAFNVTDEYAYYCKVEVMPLGINDAEEAGQVVGEFLSHILPELMWCLPDWQKVQAGEYPPNKP